MQLRIRDLKVQIRVRLLQTIVASGVANTKGCARLGAMALLFHIGLSVDTQQKLASTGDRLSKV